MQCRKRQLRTDPMCRACRPHRRNQWGAQKGDFVAIALSTPRNPLSAPINLKTPCGSCRQVMIELMGEDALVLIEGAGEFTVGELLPFGFRL